MLIQPVDYFLVARSAIGSRSRCSPNFRILAETPCFIASALACHASQLAYEDRDHGRAIVGMTLALCCPMLASTSSRLLGHARGRNRPPLPSRRLSSVLKPPKARPSRPC
jgi:hypothetical protein